MQLPNRRVDVLDLGVQKEIESSWGVLGVEGSGMAKFKTTEFRRDAAVQLALVLACTRVVSAKVSVLRLMS